MQCHCQCHPEVTLLYCLLYFTTLQSNKLSVLMGFRKVSAHLHSQGAAS